MGQGTSQQKQALWNAQKHATGSQQSSIRLVSVVGSSLLPTIEVVEPCTNSWDSMPGDERVRHCSECNLNVYNSTGLSVDELFSLVTDREGRLCMRLYKRADGSVVTRDCREARALGVRRGLAQLLSEFSLHHVAHLALIFLLSAFLGPPGVLIWLSLVLVIRFREWAPQMLKLLGSPHNQGPSSQQRTSRLVQVARLPPMRFIGLTGTAYVFVLSCFAGLGLFVVASSLAISAGQVLLDGGSIVDLFTAADEELGGVRL